jgi:hypothetical protein
MCVPVPQFAVRDVERKMFHFQAARRNNKYRANAFLSPINQMRKLITN